MRSQLYYIHTSDDHSLIIVNMKSIKPSNTKTTTDKFRDSLFIEDLHTTTLDSDQFNAMQCYVVVEAGCVITKLQGLHRGAELQEPGLDLTLRRSPAPAPALADAGDVGRLGGEAGPWA